MIHHEKHGSIPLLLTVAVVLSSILTACSGPSNQSTKLMSITKDISAASGGSLSNAAGATLTIPANALSGDAHVTLADTGQINHAQGDPLAYISDSFTVTATPVTGNAQITLTHLATLQIQTHPAKQGQDILVAERVSDSVGAVHLHYSFGTTGNTISAHYIQLQTTAEGTKMR